MAVAKANKTTARERMWAGLRRHFDSVNMACIINVCLLMYV
jgi:hypothetical protein